MMQRYKRFRNDWNPFDGIDQLHRTISRLLESTTSSYEEDRYAPPVNLYVGDEEAIVAVELPGVEKDRIEISVEGSTLTIGGERETVAIEDDSTILRKERLEGKFERSVELPFPVESEKIHATLKDGVLRVTLPRAEADRPRRIEIES